MTRRALHPALQRVAALALLGIALGAAVASIASPLVEAVAARDAAVSRLARYQHMLSSPSPSGQAYNPDDLAVEHVDDADAQLALQAVVDRLARGAGVATQSVQPLSAEHLGDFGRGVWVELAFTSDLQALVEFLVSFNAERPLLLVRRLEIERGDGQHPDLFLRVKMDIGQAWRPVEQPA